jgi:hypothetical protein
VERLSGDGSSERNRDLLGTVALCAVAAVLGGVLVAAFVWSVPLSVQLLLR